jgi:hypothetical protein
MGRDWGFSRRTLLRSWLVSLLGKAAAESAQTGFDPVSFTLRGFVPTAGFQQRYRMDATILLLGAPLFTRQAAGGGYASVEISRDQGATAMALQFAAGSSPARAHGLNRFGILREALVLRGAATELSFAGLMTRSHEESFEQGRKALASSARGAEGVVARGRTVGSTIQTWIDSIDLAPDCNWSNLNETLSDALRREPRTLTRETVSQASATFLHAMHLAALSKEAVYRREFTHAGKAYYLETRRHPDRPLELAGANYNSSGARCAEFRTTYASGDDSGIPLRIEYRPRSFLRLTFIAEPEATQPPIPSVFHQESA